MTQFLLVRPGSTAFDEQHRIRGTIDLPLSERGRLEATRLAEQLSTSTLGALYSAPCESARRTAEAIGRAVGLRVKVLDDLRNLDHGLWQGLQVEEVRRRHVRLYREWLDDPLSVSPPQGESVSEALERLRGLLKPLAKRHKGQLVAVVLAEPLAQLAGCVLRCEAPTELDDSVRTGDFELITVSDRVIANGSAS